MALEDANTGPLVASSAARFFFYDVVCYAGGEVGYDRYRRIADLLLASATWVAGHSDYMGSELGVHANFAGVSNRAVVQLSLCW